MSRVTDDVREAASALRHGDVVAIPTETVYGLAADADNIDAIERVFDLKRRPRSHPLIVHVANMEDAETFGELDDRTRQLVGVLWPGPLTIVVPRLPRASDAITGGLDTVALRMPSHPVTLALLEEFGGAVVAPSANKFGKVSPTRPAHVVADFEDVDLLILDGGECSVGLESTIVDCTTDKVQVLRPGAVSMTDIESILHESTATATGPSRAPGMLKSHYAPDCAVEIHESAADAGERARQLEHQGIKFKIIDRSEDSLECARRLYADLRDCDDSKVAVALFVAPPDVGIGRAVRDRLRKAAAPRP